MTAIFGFLIIIVLLLVFWAESGGEAEFKFWMFICCLLTFCYCLSLLVFK